MTDQKFYKNPSTPLQSQTCSAIPFSARFKLMRQSLYQQNPNSSPPTVVNSRKANLTAGKCGEKSQFQLLTAKLKQNRPGPLKSMYEISPNFKFG
jgi:hypothetical protein